VTLGTWLLVGLCAAGFILAIAYVIPVFLAVKQLRARLEALKHSRLFVSAMSLQLQANRFSRIAERARAVAQRGSTAVASIETSVEEIRMPQAREAIGGAGAGIVELAEDLR
jgi:hypothetical protein